MTSSLGTAEDAAPKASSPSVQGGYEGPGGSPPARGMSVVKVGVMCLRAGDSQLPEPEGGQASACGVRYLAVPTLGLTSPSRTRSCWFSPSYPHIFHFLVHPVAVWCSVLLCTGEPSSLRRRACPQPLPLMAGEGRKSRLNWTAGAMTESESCRHHCTDWVALG